MPVYQTVAAIIGVTILALLGVLSWWIRSQPKQPKKFKCKPHWTEDIIYHENQ